LDHAWTQWRIDHETLQQQKIRLHDLLHKILKVINERILAHPLVDKCHAYSRQVLVGLYKRSLPYLAEISKNTILASSLALAAGVLVTYWSLSAYYNAYYRSIIKSRTMSGVTCDDSKYAGLDSLHLRSDLIVPRISRPHQVLVRIHAASVDLADVAILSGLGRTERRYNSEAVGDPNSKLVLGRDFSGVVLDVGRQVVHVGVGDAVWSAQPLAANGTLSEFVVIDGNSVRLKPVHLGHDGAATLPYSGLRVWNTLVKEAGLRPPSGLKGKHVLVVDGGSPTGCIAIQVKTLRYATLLYSTLLYATLRYSTLLYATLRYSTLLYATLH
jgi:hypothetical protein